MHGIKVFSTGAQLCGTKNIIVIKTLKSIKKKIPENNMLANAGGLGCNMVVSSTIFHV